MVVTINEVRDAYEKRVDEVEPEFKRKLEEEIDGALLREYRSSERRYEFRPSVELGQIVASVADGAKIENWVQAVAAQYPDWTVVYKEDHRNGHKFEIIFEERPSS